MCVGEMSSGQHTIVGLEYVSSGLDRRPHHHKPSSEPNRHDRAVGAGHAGELDVWVLHNLMEIANDGPRIRAWWNFC